MKKTEELVEEALNELDNLHGIESGQIPDIGMYMDQVTSFMEKNLDAEKRHPEDKVLTKAMINNYTKNHLLPPPEKKKYSRNHVLIMILLFYYKNFFSFNDIGQLIEPLTDEHFQSGSDIPLPQIYDKLLCLCEDQRAALREDIREKMKTAATVFCDEDSDDTEYLKMFSLISELFSDIYAKNKVIEYLTDKLAEENEKKDASAKKKK